MRPFTPGAEIRGPDAMLRSFVLCSLATTATATAPRPALLQLRGGGGAKGGAVEEQPKTGKLWVGTLCRNQGQCRWPSAAQAADWPRLAASSGQPEAQNTWRREEEPPERLLAEA